MADLPAHIIFFDGYCNLCSGAVQFIIKKDKKQVYKFASLQSAIAQQILASAPENIRNSDSIVYVTNGKFYNKSTAALQLSSKLNGLWKYAYIFLVIPPFIRDFVYDIIAKYRYKWFGKKDSCMIPTAALKERFLEERVNL